MVQHLYYRDWLSSLKTEDLFKLLLDAQMFCEENIPHFTYRGFGVNGSTEFASIFLMYFYLLETVDEQSSEEFLLDILYGIKAYTDKKFDILGLSTYWDQIINKQLSLTLNQWHYTYNYLKDNLDWWIQMQGISKACYIDELMYKNLKKHKQAKWIYREIEIEYDENLNYNPADIFPTYHFYPGTPRCPICNKSMFKSIFPIGKEFSIKCKLESFSIKRIFTCHKCQTFYAPVPGYFLSERNLLECKIQDSSEYQAFLNMFDILTTKEGRDDV